MISVLTRMIRLGQQARHTEQQPSQRRLATVPRNADTRMRKNNEKPSQNHSLDVISRRALVNHLLR